VGAALAEVVPVDGGPTAVAALHGLRSFTEAPACAVGWCPQPTAPAGTGPVSLLLAVGTYLLEPEAGTAEAEAARQARLSGTPEPEPEAAPADSASEAAVAAGLDAPGLRDADPDKREQQRRQQTRSGTIRLYSVQLAPVEHPLPVPQGSGRKNERSWRDTGVDNCAVLPLAAGALDLNWCPWRQRDLRPNPANDDTSPRLAVACADGSLNMLRLSPSPGSDDDATVELMGKCSCAADPH
jgi:hypothetical protein